MNTNFKLPERWCIKRSPENYKELNPLLKQVNGRIYTGTGENMYKKFDYFHNIPFKQRTYIGSRQYNYVEITLEQLKNSLTTNTIMENFAIKSDQNNPLFKEFIKWTNEKYNRDFIGGNGYYTISEGKVYCTTFQLNRVLVSLQYWNEHIRNNKHICNNESKKIIGYELIKPEYTQVALKALKLSNKEPYTPFIIRGMIAYYLPKIEELGIKEWFEPVYEDPEPQLPQIASYNGKIEGNELVYGCQRVPISLFDTKKCNLEFMVINGVTVCKEHIDQIRKVLVHGKFI